jgi:hypothetical protein
VEFFVIEDQYQEDRHSCLSGELARIGRMRQTGMSVLLILALRQFLSSRFRQHGLDLIDKIAGVFELAINAGETNVGHLVEFAEPPHHQFAQLTAGDLRLEFRFQFVFHRGDDRFELSVADGPFPTRGFQPAFDFLAVKRLPRAIFFDDFDGCNLDPLISGKPPLASHALPPPADGIAIFTRPGVEHAIVVFVAKRAFHGSNSLQKDTPNINHTGGGGKKAKV